MKHYTRGQFTITITRGYTMATDITYYTVPPKKDTGE